MREEIHSELSRAVIKPLLYSDIFNYPLTASEIFDRLEIPCDDIKAVECELQQLVEARVLFRFHDLYSLRDDASLALRRQAGNKMAKDIMPKAVRRSQLIYNFPFVRAVMISGSLSKDFMEKSGDIDFFIVTAPGRVWITRGLLALFQRVALFNSHKYFCVNYYLDYNHLLLDERNIFTATELITLKPMRGNEYYTALLRNNDWVREYYPQFKPATIASKPGLSRMKKVFEKVLDPFAPWLDSLVMKKLVQRAQRLHGHRYEQKDFDVAFKATPHVSKNHAGNYQRRITDKFHQSVRSFFGDLVRV
ncbi:MAG: nucleotidyltransferase domain-containing protein [Bacteroidota bacterium]